MRQITYSIILLLFSLYCVKADQPNKEYDQTTLCALKVKADEGDLAASLELAKFLYQPVPFDYWKILGIDFMRNNVDIPEAIKYFKMASPSHDKSIHDDAVYHLAMLYFMKTYESLNSYFSNQGVAEKKLSDQAIYWAEQLRMIEPNQGNFLLAELYNIDNPQLKDSAKSEMYLAKAVDGKFPQALLEKAFAANTGSQKIELPKEAIKLINLAANTGNIQAIHMRAAITLEGDIKTYEEWRMTRDQAFAVMRKNAEKGYVPSIRALIKFDDGQKEKWQEIYNKMLSDQEIGGLANPPLTGSSDKTLNRDEKDLVNKSERDKRRLYKSCP